MQRTNWANHLEGGLGGDSIDENVAVNPHRILPLEDAVFILFKGEQMKPETARMPSWESANLSSRVHNLGEKLIALELDELVESVLNCWVIRLHKVILDKSNGDSGLAYKENAQSGYARIPTARKFLKEAPPFKVRNNLRYEKRANQSKGTMGPRGNFQQTTTRTPCKTYRRGNSTNTYTHSATTRRKIYIKKES